LESRKKIREKYSKPSAEKSEEQKQQEEEIEKEYQAKMVSVVKSSDRSGQILLNAFGLPRTATYGDILKTKESLPTLTPFQEEKWKFYGEPMFRKRISAIALKEESERRRTAEGEILANQSPELKQIIAEGDERREKAREFRNIQIDEDRRIADAIAEYRKLLQSKMTDDKIDNLPIQVAFKEILNGEILRKQINKLEEAAIAEGYDTPLEYVEAYNNSSRMGEDRQGNPKVMPPIVIFDAEKATDDYKRELESQIGFLDKVGHYSRVGALLLADIAAEVLPYVMPAVGTALSLGWKAFAPEGSMNYQEGTIGQKFGRLAVSAVETGVKKLIGLGQQKRRRMMEKMMDDEVELHGGRGQASGFVMRMMAENKKKHKGQYRNPSTNDYGSSMKSFRAFDLAKMETPSKFLKEHFSGEPVPFVSRRAEKKAEDTALASIRASKMSQADAKAKMEEARKKIGEKPQYQILYNAFRRYVSV
jgi:hypothetical protein